MRIATGEAKTTDGGVPGGAELRRLMTAILGDPEDLGAARAACVEHLGPEAAAQAVSLIASFDGINRVADATGIRLDPETATGAGAQITEILGYEQLAAARS